LRVGSIMSKPVISVRKSATIKEVVKKMNAKKIGSIVITEKKVPIGIFTKSDLLAVLDASLPLEETRVDSVMATPVLPVGEQEKFTHVARHMNRFDTRHFIVVDKGGKLVGIVTDIDIVKNFATSSFSYQETLAGIASEGFTATPSTPLKKIANMMLSKRASCVVIIKGKKPVGVVNEVLFISLTARFKEPLKYKAEDKMIKKFCRAGLEDPLRASVLSMIKKNLRSVVLSDEKGKLSGVISLKELVGFIIKSRL